MRSSPPYEPRETRVARPSDWSTRRRARLTAPIVVSLSTGMLLSTGDLSLRQVEDKAVKSGDRLAMTPSDHDSLLRSRDQRYPCVTAIS